MSGSVVVTVRAGLLGVVLGVGALAPAYAQTSVKHFDENTRAGDIVRFLTTGAGKRTSSTLPANMLPAVVAGGGGRLRRVEFHSTPTEQSAAAPVEQGAVAADQSATRSGGEQVADRGAPAAADGPAPAGGDCPAVGAPFTVDIKFALNSSYIEPTTYRVLKEVADAMRDPDLLGCGFLVEGHTDASGSAQANKFLSTRRAENVGEFLHVLGVETGRLSVSGKGSSDPLDPKNPTAAINRRVQFQVVAGAHS